MHHAILIAGVVGDLVVFLTLAPMLAPEAMAVRFPIYRMRAFGCCAFVFLTPVLAIGPLALRDATDPHRKSL